MNNVWLTALGGEVEKEHKSYDDAVFWAQGTHCTERRPKRQGESYILGRTTIVRKSVWEKWQLANK